MGWELDFHGQRLAEWIYRIGIVSFTIVGFVLGYIQQDFKYTFYAWAAGTALSCLAVLPPWPYLRAHPLQYLPSLASNDETAASTQESRQQNAPTRSSSNSKPPAAKGAAKGKVQKGRR